MFWTGLEVGIFIGALLGFFLLGAIVEIRKGKKRNENHLPVLYSQN